MTDSPKTVPPNQPKWMLKMQVWLLRHRLMGPMGRSTMVITTTGRKSGKQFSVPISYVRDGGSYLALNYLEHSNWLKNVRANPRVSLNVQGREFPATGCEEVTDTPDQVRGLLRVYQREQPKQVERTFGATPDSPDEQLLRVAQDMSFVRFIEER